MIINLTEQRTEDREQRRTSKFASWMSENKNSPFPIPYAAQKGFTLVETLVAISILLITITGPISVIGNALYKIYYAKDQMIAINLAQEGVEAVRQVRDSNMLGGGGTWTGLGAGSYIIDAGSLDTPASFVRPCSGCDQKVYFHATTGLYRQGEVSSPTQFSRIVTISSSGAGDERQVISTVTWRTGGRVGSVSSSGYLFKTF